MNKLGKQLEQIQQDRRTMKTETVHLLQCKTEKIL